MSTEAEIGAVVDEVQQRLNGSVVWKPKNKRGWYVDESLNRSSSAIHVQRTITDTIKDVCPGRGMWWFIQRCESELRKRLQ